MYEHCEDTVPIGVYDDHAASAGSDELEYAVLCEVCAEERNGDVTHLSTIDAGGSLYCDECSSPNRTEEVEESY